VTLKFHREVYAGEAVDEAVKMFANHATFELTEQDDYWVVEVSANKPAAERRLVGELCNFALGLTADRRGAQ
jgi:hypothetical protein